MIAAETLPPTAPPHDAWFDLVPPDLRDDPTSLRHPDATLVLNGMVWSRLGDGPQAWAWFQRVTEPELSAWVSIEKARFLRELGMHEAAEDLDLRALAVASDLADVVAARLSLAADAVGRGEFEVARLRLQGADAILNRAPTSPRFSRQRLRRAWVAVEVALVHGDPPPIEALPHLDGGQVWFPPEQAHGTRFHAAKGLLFGSVAHDEPELLDLALADAPPILQWAVHLARADRGVPDALQEARAAFALVTPPTQYTEDAMRTDTARRLRA